MIRLDILRHKGYRLTFETNKITATRGDKVFQAHNLTKLFNHVKNNHYIQEDTIIDESIIDPHNLEQFFNQQNL
jgi:D-alanyl-D-alanine carboxypeptidase